VSPLKLGCIGAGTGLAGIVYYDAAGKQIKNEAVRLHSSNSTSYALQSVAPKNAAAAIVYMGQLGRSHAKVEVWRHENTGCWKEKGGLDKGIADT
jgi:hypothetical protein